MIQPGAFGDIIVCAPIAKAYSDAGYDVYWPARLKFKDTLNKFDYVNYIELNNSDDTTADWLKSDVEQCIQLCHDMNFDYVLNLADRGPHPTAELPHETFDETKYRLAQIPFEEKHNLSWTRDADAEDQLYELIAPKKDYILCHLSCAGPNGDDGSVDLPIEPTLPVVRVTEIGNYSIFDWYKVIKNAKEIYCLESSVQCFIDGIAMELNCPKYLLSRPTWINGKAPWKQNLGDGRYGNNASTHWRYDYIK